MHSAIPKTAIKSFCQRGVLRIGIHRPEKKNVLALAMYQAMADALIQADGDPAVRVILLHGHCSGAETGKKASSHGTIDQAVAQGPAPTTSTEQALLTEAGHFLRMLGQPEAREALTAFFERRAPKFSQFE